MLKTAMSGIIVALLIGQIAHADEALPHQLTIHLPNHAEWQMDVSLNISSEPGNVRVVNSKAVRSFRNHIVVNKPGFVVTRNLISNGPKPDTALPDVNDITEAYTALLNTIEYSADASLTPMKVNNLSEILQKKTQFEKKIFGAAITNEMEEQGRQITSESIIAQHLLYETLMGHLRQTPLSVGMPQTSPDTLSAIDGSIIAAQTTLTLTKWDEASDQAIYKFSTRADAQAKTQAALRFFLALFYPLNTMDDDQMKELKQQAADQVKVSEYTNEMSCQFVASIKTGLVTIGQCDVVDNLKSPLFSQSYITHIDLTQRVLP